MSLSTAYLLWKSTLDPIQTKTKLPIQSCITIHKLSPTCISAVRRQSAVTCTLANSETGINRELNRFNRIKLYSGTTHCGTLSLSAVLSRGRLFVKGMFC